MKRLLKLTGGSYRGKKLYVPAGGVRPATNLVREAVFSTLYSFFEEGVSGLQVLDLFAGTGSLGLEAISRGAAGVTFVDSSRASIEAIRRNLELLEFSARVVRSDVQAFVRRSGFIAQDLIFMDPPYRYRHSQAVVSLLLDTLGRGKSASRPPILVHERSYDEQLPDFAEGAEILRRKKYGQTEILYYRLCP
jgi:16S rRNA (guanine966-N2)-methyltransferase